MSDRFDASRIVVQASRPGRRRWLGHGLALGSTAALGSALLGAPGRAGADPAFPSQPVRIVIPVVPGGNLDLITRALAEEMSRGLGQPVVIENQPGASSVIGTQRVARSAPDGYTLLAIANTFATVPALMPTAGYDPVADFAGVSVMCLIPMMLVVNTGLPVTSVAALVESARRRPGTIRYATAGSGSTGHIAAELFCRAAGVQMTMVPYKGNAQAVADVAGGHVDMMFDQVSSAEPHVRSGKLRPLAVTSRTRSAIFPEVPTVEEAGFPGFEETTFNGLLAPKSVPAAVLRRLQTEVARSIAAGGLVERFAARGIEMVASESPEAFTRFISQQVDKYRALVRDAGIKVG
ncbi:MAG: tripartite tricarboxylate transporter substrate binding protein [Lautropia sp.]